MPKDFRDCNNPWETLRQRPETLMFLSDKILQRTDYKLCKPQDEKTSYDTAI